MPRAAPCAAARVCTALMASLLLGATLPACGSSSENVVQGAKSSTAPTTQPPTTQPTSTQPPITQPPTTQPPTTSSTGKPAIRVIPRTKLRDGQTVLVRASGFSAGQPFTIIECADKGKSTGPGDCNLPGMLTATSDARGTLEVRLPVLKGPFGANKVVCSATQACLISVTQASLSPTEEADRVISFGP